MKIHASARQRVTDSKLFITYSTILFATVMHTINTILLRYKMPAFSPCIGLSQPILHCGCKWPRFLVQHQQISKKLYDIVLIKRPPMHDISIFNFLLCHFRSLISWSNVRNLFSLLHWLAQIQAFRKFLFLNSALHIFMLHYVFYLINMFSFVGTPSTFV